MKAFIDKVVAHALPIGLGIGVIAALSTFSISSHAAGWGPLSSISLGIVAFGFIHAGKARQA